jgi:hypothetical protein
MHARKQYLEEIRKEYEQADLIKRGRLLEEAQKRTRMNRKYLIRALGRRQRLRRLRRGRRGRPRAYGAAVLTALVAVWEIFEYPCGQRLAPILRRAVTRLRRLGELRCTDEVAGKLGAISARAIDRLLAREKQVRQLKRERNPSVHPLLYQRVPVKVASEWDTNELGNLQVDYVAHCGRSSGGEYVQTISTVDMASGWWEGQAIAGRSQRAPQEGLDRIRPRGPFRIREIHPDNDSGLINDLLWRYCQKARIRMSRSRPYQKNDNAWVEQKNWTHVRKVVGYRRYDTMRWLALLNQIYEVARLYQNFFQPVMKLKSKTRVGGKIHRVYDEPRTPYQRLLESGQISRKVVGQLRETYESLNPVALHRQLESLRRELFELADAKLPVILRRRQRGPDIVLGRRRTVGMPAPPVAWSRAVPQSPGAS